MSEDRTPKGICEIGIVSEFLSRGFQGLESAVGELAVLCHTHMMNREGWEKGERTEEEEILKKKRRQLIRLRSALIYTMMLQIAPDSHTYAICHARFLVDQESQTTS